MSRRVIGVIEDKKWNRDIMNIYWSFFVFITIMELITLFFAKGDIFSYIFRNILTPSLELLLIIGITEILYHYCPKLINPSVLVIVGSLMVAVVINAHADVDGATTAFFLPLLVAVSYFEKKLLIIASSFNTVSFITLYLVNDSIQKRILPYDFVVVIGFITIGAYLCYVLMNRRINIIDNLEKVGQDRDVLLELNAIMDQQIKIDMLTGLYNQAAFYKHLEDTISQHHNNQLPVHLALFDIDDFKGINDTFGHLTGDEILKQIASIVKKLIGNDDFIARYGGDEFAIIFTDKTNTQVMEIINNMRRTISKYTFRQLANKHITISCGISKYRSDWTKEELFNKTDYQLYEAKRNGKNIIKAAYL